MPRPSLLILAPLALLLQPPAATAQTPVATAPFNAVELRDGGKVTLVHGDEQRVRITRGDPAGVAVTVTDGRLRIRGVAGRGSHRDRDRLEIEVVTPPLNAVAVSNGGSVESRGAFPAQGDLAVSVNQGGGVDLRSAPADRVTASVHSGGRILVRPSTSLTAAVADGGQITYWGSPVVTSAVHRGGAVREGTSADADRPLAEFNPSPPRLPTPAAPPPAPAPVRPIP